jgi:hypothetical protein
MRNESNEKHYRKSGHAQAAEKRAAQRKMDTAQDLQRGRQKLVQGPLQDASQPGAGSSGATEDATSTIAGDPQGGNPLQALLSRMQGGNG